MLVALALAACGASASAPPPNGEPVCSAPIEPVPSPVTLRVHNRRDSTVYFDPSSPLCRARVALSGNAGQTLAAELTVAESARLCAAVIDGGSPALDCIPGPLEPLEPGASRDFVWDGLALAEEVVPASCSAAEATPTCLARAPVKSGVIVATVSFYTDVACGPSGCKASAATHPMSVDRSFELPGPTLVEIDLT